jgi:hypothetical protein
MTDDWKLFERFTVPAPPPEVRGRALGAGRAAVREVAGATATRPPRRAGWSRWDLAWLAALVVLVVGNIALSANRGQPDVAAAANETGAPGNASARRSTEEEWRELGVAVEANHTQPRSERPLTVERWLEDPVLRRLATE